MISKRAQQAYLASTLALVSLVPRFVFAALLEKPTFYLFTVKASCEDTEVLTCWIASVFSWSQMAILLLSTVVIVLAGIIYMTSAGNERQITLAKKLILGALTGVTVIVLGKFFLTVVIGVPWVN